MARPQVSYPGVYVQEVPSGVRTIVGVSTSVAAFIGWAKSGPVNQAIQIFNFSDYEREFGGLDRNSEMSYGVRQFFMNGGREAWIVKVAKDAEAATRILTNETYDVLTVTALAQGNMGNFVALEVNYDSDIPGSHFNLTVDFDVLNNPAASTLEHFENLSMNSESSRYVLTVINGVSDLISVHREHDGTGLSAGYSLSGDLTDLFTAGAPLDESHNRIRVSVDGSSPVAVDFDPLTILDGTSLCARVKAVVLPLHTDFECELDTSDGQQRIRLTSGTDAETSSVRVLPGLGNDASVLLKLSSENGGLEVDAAAAMRPTEMPDHGQLQSGSHASTDFATSGPGVDHRRFLVSLDGLEPLEVDLGDDSLDIDEIASRIETEVRELPRDGPAYKEFTCSVDTNTLLLQSGSRGSGSSVNVTEADGDTLAADLLLLPPEAILTEGKDETLGGGYEAMFTEGEAYPIVIGSKAQREGIYALEAVDIFNLLCIPGLTHTGILADAEAYCRERRAFLLADSRAVDETPREMADTIQGTTYPKSCYGAVYYPWIEISDPLQNGKARKVAPCGTIAGLFARTDGTRGVWKAPAGTEATLTGVRGAKYKLTDMENGTLNPLGVNCIRVFPTFGAIAWGSRTLRGADQMASEYKYTPVRRTALFIEESLYRGMKWVVFEPNAEPLWAQIRLNVGAFMHDLFRQGAFKGVKPRGAYFVKCDAETTTQNDINLGIVNVWVGFAPLKPAEFVILYLQQMAGQIET